MKTKEPTKVPNKDILERLNFLSTISHEAGMRPELLDLAQFYGTQANFTAKKAQVRIKPKFLFCKKCKGPLTVPCCASVTIHSNYIIYKCKVCGTSKRIYKSSDKTEPSIPHKCFIQDFTVQPPKLIKEYSNQ